ncbi:sugar-binding transcriptional regulator [Streptococcus hongkongensis]|nr:DeoR faimly transcriptional regulator [Streptococcus uberis]
MREERRRLIAKIAYMHHVKEKSQTQISKEMGIYRTTVCRMLAKAKEEGIVQVTLKGYDTELFALEEYVKEKYLLENIEIIANSPEDDDTLLLQKMGKAAAEIVRNLIEDGDRIGLSWGSSLSAMIDHFEAKVTNDVVVLPLGGGPSHVNAHLHVNSLIYRLAKDLKAKSVFINEKVIQENTVAVEAFKSSGYYKNTLQKWSHLNMAIVGIGGELDKNETSQWRDLLTDKDYKNLQEEQAIGEVSYRFYNKKGIKVCSSLQDRTIGITIEQLTMVPKTIAIARGAEKTQALLAALRAGFMNYLITDRETILAVLALDGDKYYGR